MTQTLKRNEKFNLIKTKSFKHKRQVPQKTQSFIKNRIKKAFTRTESSKKKGSILQFEKNKKKHYLFLKLIQKISKETQAQSRFQQNYTRSGCEFFLNKISLPIKSKLNANERKRKNFFVTPVKNLSQKLDRRQKKLDILRHEKKSKLLPSFYEPWKNIKLTPTKKQQWLNSAYAQYQYLRFRDRFDFFRGYLGQIMLLTELHSSEDYKSSWFSRYFFSWKTRHLKRSNLDLFKRLYENYKITSLSTQKLRSKILVFQKQGWWYENLVQKKKVPKSLKKFVLDRPQTAFRIHWKQQKREPWKNALLFKRAVYSGFGEHFRKENKFQTLKIKPYLRRKNPRYEKRNRIYHKATILLANRRQKFRIKANKIARIKQITSKILFPFYGNLRLNQRHKIIKKSRVIKSKQLSSNELILLHFESRLDVVVYRLNLAPTILWARRLILDGCIFVSPQNLYQNQLKWNSMYASLKKYAFPLKLRDPKNLYASTILKNLPEHWGTFKFLDHPQTNVSYLLQPGDLIQCSLENSLNQFKSASFLWQKPFPSHLLTAKKKMFLWEWLSQKYVSKSFLTWDHGSEKVNSAVFLRTPLFTDLPSTDRIKESFLRWAVL
jgi:ribosomal protein S4